MTELPDQELVKKAAAGDLAAITSLITFYQRPIYNHLFRLVGNAEDASDLTQETFIKLYKNRKKIDPSSNFRAWLYKIATNTAYDWFKKSKKGRELLIIDDENQDIETYLAKMPYNTVDEDEIRDLEASLGKLKPKHKEILLLYYQKGFEYQEIAQILSIPLNTVKNRMFRAKEELRGKMQ